MDLTLSGDIAKQIISLTKKDNRLAVALARQFLTSVEPLAMARYLLTADVATDLLARRISHNPEQTIRQLQNLVGSSTRPGRGRRSAGKTSGQRPGRPRRRRHRLTPKEIDRIKSDVRSFLGQHPWSNRKQIGDAVSFPSLAAYNRIMSELRSEKVIQAKGEKSKTVYAVKGNSKPAGRKPRTKKVESTQTE